MFHVILFRPEIPPNTGNVMRMAANSGVSLHLVEPLGFSLSDRLLKRAGMDYRDLACVTVHDNWDVCAQAVSRLSPLARYFALSTRGCRAFHEPAYRAGDVFVFGSETAGLPQYLLDRFEPEQQLRIPMREGSRSLNLSNSVAVVVYEAWRQHGFAGAVTPP